MENVSRRTASRIERYVVDLALWLIGGEGEWHATLWEDVELTRQKLHRHTIGQGVEIACDDGGLIEL